MKHQHHLLSCLLLSFALPATAAVDAFVETKTFYGDGFKPTVGIHFAFNGASAVHLANERGFQQASLEVLTIIQKNGAILDFRKTLVQGPERTDDNRPDFLHTESFQLDPGVYDLLFELRDLNGVDTTVGRFSQPLAVAPQGTGLFFSDILWAERFEAIAV